MRVAVVLAPPPLMSVGIRHSKRSLASGGEPAAGAASKAAGAGAATRACVATGLASAWAGVDELGAGERLFSRLIELMETFSTIGLVKLRNGF